MSYPNQKPVVAPGNAAALCNPVPGYSLKQGFVGAAMWLEADAEKLLQACRDADLEKVQVNKAVTNGPDTMHTIIGNTSKS